MNRKVFDVICSVQRAVLIAVLASAVLFFPTDAMAGSQKDSIDEGHPAVREFASRMASLHSLTADVECIVSRPDVKMTAPLTGSLEAEGECYVIKMDGLEIYCDGKSRWQYLPEQNEVTIATLSDVSVTPLDRPLQLFREYSKLFKVRYRGEHVKDGTRYFDFSFYPRDLRQPYSQIHVSVVASSYLPYKMTYMGKDGVSYLLTLKNFKRNVPVRSDFSFNAKEHKGIEIIDLR